MNFRQRSVVFLAEGFHVGKIPLAPGTWGSLEALPLCYLLSKIDLKIALPVTVIFTVCAIWVSHGASALLRQKDPGRIVIDEAAGMTVALLGVPFNLFNAAAGFLLFRFFDILKPFPVRQVENRVPGGAGIVLDDVAAGVYANLALRGVLWLL